MRHSRQAIEREIRQRICGGTYAPGARLPLRRELLREFGASPLTLQRAMDRLAEQGFIEARGTQGTFVAGRLPNRGTIALIVPADPGKGPINRFWNAILRTAEGWQGEVTFRPYYLDDRHLDVPEHRRLCVDLADGGLAGMLCVSSPHWLVGSPVLAAAIPRVCIGTSSAESVAKYRSSYLGFGDGRVEEAALRRFRADGRKRVAFLSHPSRTECQWLPLLRELGLETRPEWWIGLSPSYPESAQPVMRLLCSWPAASRPDCLMITDDNLVPHATAGVLDAGLRPPRDLAVAAHANFPFPTHAAFPCLRFGVDVAAMLHAAAAEVARLADGGKPSTVMVDRVIRDAVTG